ncbi:hypothetical protein CLOM_g8184 [Closterium sp. NIES-68]|nr:hypothetical protein CLOM_g8184 [Closterium sp. NIES-68]
MRPQVESQSPSTTSYLPTEYLDAPTNILVPRHHEATADDNGDNNDDKDGDNVGRTEIVASHRTAVLDQARANDSVPTPWSDTEAMQLVRAFVELESDAELKRAIRPKYNRELHSLLLHKHPEFRHSQAAVKSKLARMKNNYYRLQNRLELSAVSRTDPLPVWYVLMDSVMERDVRELRKAISMGASRENGPEARRILESRSRGAVARQGDERMHRTPGSHDLAPSNDTPAYAFPALPSLPTAAPSATAAVPSSPRHVAPAPLFARASSAVHAPNTTAAAAVASTPIVSTPSIIATAPASASAGSTLAAQLAAALSTTPAPATAAAADLSPGINRSGVALAAPVSTGFTPASVVAPSVPAPSAHAGGSTPLSTLPAPSEAPALAADGAGASYLQSLRAATIPNSARGDRLTPPSSAQNERCSLSPSAQDGMQMSPPSAAQGDQLTPPPSTQNGQSERRPLSLSAGRGERLASPPARYDRRMPPSFAQQGRRMAAGAGGLFEAPQEGRWMAAGAGGFTGWRGSRRGGWAWRRERDSFAADPEAGNADHMAGGSADNGAAADSLGAAMDKAVESAFTDFQGMAQEWVESACAEFEGLVAEMAERACFQFRSAGREFAEAWKARQESKKPRRF